MAFLSPSIFSSNDSELTSDLDNNAQPTSVSSSVQYNADPFQELDAHLELSGVCSSGQQMNEEEGLHQQVSKRLKLDREQGSSSSKRSFAINPSQKMR